MISTERNALGLGVHNIQYRLKLYKYASVNLLQGVFKELIEEHGQMGSI